MPRKPHAVWQYFEVVVPRRAPGKTLPDVRCALCGASIRNARVTKDLLPHVAACVLAPESAKRLSVIAKQKSSAKDAAGPRARVLTLKERELYGKLAEGMEAEGTPFGAVEQARFKRLFKYLFPHLRAPRGLELSTCCGPSAFTSKDDMSMQKCGASASDVAVATRAPTSTSI